MCEGGATRYAPTVNDAGHCADRARDCRLAAPVLRLCGMRVAVCRSVPDLPSERCPKSVALGSAWTALRVLWSKFQPKRHPAQPITRAKGATYATSAEIASAESINGSYVARILRLTLLAPDIVEAILEGRQPAGATLALLMRSFPVGWTEHRAGILSRN